MFCEWKNWHTKHSSYIMIVEGPTCRSFCSSDPYRMHGQTEWFTATKVVYSTFFVNYEVYLAKILVNKQHLDNLPSRQHFIPTTSFYIQTKVGFIDRKFHFFFGCAVLLLIFFLKKSKKWLNFRSINLIFVWIKEILGMKFVAKVTCLKVGHQHVDWVNHAVNENVE